MKELSHLCLRLGWSKVLRGKGGIAPMCLIPLWSKALSEVWDTAPMGQWPLGSHTLNDGWLPVHMNGIQLRSASTSQQGGCIWKRSSRIVVPHHPQVNVGLVWIHQYYQQIIMCWAQLPICCVRKIEKNSTTVRRSRDHKHISQFMKENLCCQMSCHHLESIEITFACRF